MAYMVFEIDVPPNTLQSAPLIVEQEVPLPVIKRMEINIPNGHQGLAKLRIEDRARALIPTPGSNPMYVRGDGDQIEVVMNYRIDGPKWVLRFIAWNDDTTFDHTFLINMDLERD